ncbi:beta-glucosidase [Streptomyces malaysiensis]|uniref:Beta-glucosidase n=1 Tax=Streptomyces malaysiensis TaxID=92644 RepID=A0A7X5WYC0_STRMQ|nr:beta-glucosidase [Streptomyces malaysiensis]
MAQAERTREAVVEAALARLDLNAKTRLLAGQDRWSLPALPQIGLKSLVMSDGPIGVRGVRWTADDPSIALPSPTALAATWDQDLARRAGVLLAQEARRKGVHVLLGRGGQSRHRRAQRTAAGRPRRHSGGRGARRHRPAGPHRRRGPGPRGVFIGYRAWEKEGRTPAYPFGHGLGYTDWTYESVESDGTTATVHLRNTGERTGREVVQVYLSPGEPGAERPARWLAAFAIVEAGPGESAEVTVGLPRRAFEIWDEKTAAWSFVGGSYEIEVGRSITDRHVRTTIRI